jgi:low affinity Fe/Cu permease
MYERFSHFAHRTAEAVGSSWSFFLACLLIAIWGLTGPMFHYSDTWQLVINTGTTIVTFLMVFLIQNTQNRDSRALQLKLDELLRGVKGARTGLVNLEACSDQELDELQKEFEALREAARNQKQRRATRHGGHSSRQLVQGASGGEEITSRQAPRSQ